MIKALQFHRITNKFQFCGTWNYPEQLNLFLKTILDCGYDIVLPGEDRDGIIITFDDGEENLYQHAFPVLKRYSCSAMIFLVANYIGKRNYWDISILGKRSYHLNWDQILEMRKSGIMFGSHTMSHRNLTRIDVQGLEYELFESKRILEKYLGEVDTISYPFNRINTTVLKKVAEAGYRYGFGGEGQNDLTIKKEAVYITDNPLTLKVKISENPSILYSYERFQQKVINYFTIATILKMSSHQRC